MQYTKVAVHGLIKKGDKFLVTKRAAGDNYMPGLWDLPGGTIEFQENIFDALMREIEEETGLRVEIGKILYCYDFPSGPDRHQFQIVYECDYTGGEVILNLDDHDEYRWLGVNEMQSLDKIGFLDELWKCLR